jgi:hypothetical protein
METMMGGLAAAGAAGGSEAVVSVGAAVEVTGDVSVAADACGSCAEGAGECLLIRFITWAVLLVSDVFLLDAIKTLL